MKFFLASLAAMIALIIASAVLLGSAATSFIAWEPQWFWSSDTGWRTALVVLLLTTRFHKS